jgi:hypothetical protein
MRGFDATRGGTRMPYCLREFARCSFRTQLAFLHAHRHRRRRWLGNIELGLRFGTEKIGGVFVDAESVYWASTTPQAALKREIGRERVRGEA